MNNRRNQNSVLVLATLGVYLGLVLVGATPQVLAHAAMAKQFNVKDEVEVKDDLDKKPDKSGASLAENFQTYLQDLDGYLADVRWADDKLGSVYGQNPEFVILAPCYKIGDANRPFIVEVSGVTRLPILFDPQYVDSNWEWMVGCKPLQSSTNEESRFAQVEVSRTQKGVFTYQVSIKLSTSVEARDLLQNLERAFKLVKAEDLRGRQKVLWENTQLVVTDDKVSIVTRLPRGSLDSLLAIDAK